MSWQPDKPVSKDKVKDLTGVIRSNKSALDNALQDSFYWSDSVASGGVPRVPEPGGSHATEGTARFIYSSVISDPGFGPVGQIDSANSRWLIYDSETSSVMGSKNMIISQTSRSPSNFSNQVQTVALSAFTNFGTASYDEKVVVWGVGIGTDFNGLPANVLLQSSDTDDISAASYSVGCHSITAAGCTLGVWYLGPGANPNACKVFVRSEATVDLPS